ncbi:MAG: hypothetical protein D6816_05460 [Bacteroidetes bacterium]|nr:MAG: hypothetical protein D6816_05460 [Bacteroidota bacterium]
MSAKNNGLRAIGVIKLHPTQIQNPEKALRSPRISVCMFNFAASRKLQDDLLSLYQVSQSFFPQKFDIKFYPL